MNLSLVEADVVAHCDEQGVAISAIETLPSGGTHLVTVNSDGAAVMRRVLAFYLIEGRVRRFNYMQAPQSQRQDPPQSPRRDPPPPRSTSPWRKPPLR
jgi:hypothetical protein